MKVIFIVGAVHVVVCLVLAVLLTPRTTATVREERNASSTAASPQVSSGERTAGVVHTGSTHTEYATTFQVPNALVLYFVAGVVALLGYGVFNAIAKP